MYNRQKILHDLYEARDLIDDWIEKVESQKTEKDFKKFYRKGQKRAGIRLRRLLKQIRDQVQNLRMDIKRTYDQRELFNEKKPGE